MRIIIVPALLLAGIVVFTPAEIQGQILINEIMASNADGIRDKNAAATDWIELFNNSSESVNLRNWSITDGGNIEDRRPLPDTLLGAGQHLLLLASGKTTGNKGIVLLKGAGRGIDRNSVSDGFCFAYLPIRGDVSLQVNIRNLQTEQWRATAGVMLREDLSHDSRYAAIMCRSPRRREYIYQQRDTAGHKPFAADVLYYKKEFPYCWLRIDRRDDSVSYFMSTDGYYWRLQTTRYFPVGADTLYAGICVSSSKSEETAACVLADFRIDRKPVSINSMSIRQVSDNPADRSGGYAPCRELHLPFKLDKEGERITLWNAEGGMVDSLSFPPQITDVSYARSFDGGPGFVFSTTPSPAAANSGGVSGRAEAPVFSLPGGFYRDAQVLRLSSADPGDSLFITLDGSPPDRQDLLYRGGSIRLDSSSVIRAIVYRRGFLPSETVTQTYLIDEATHLPVVALNIDPEELYNEDKGLFVDIWSTREVPAQLQFWERDRNVGFAMDVGVKIHGFGGGRSHPQKSMQIKARSRYGSGEIEYPLFPNKKIDAYSSFLLRNSSQDFVYTYIRDALASHIALSIGIDAQAYRPALVYVNGRYHGIMNIREQGNTGHIAANHDLDDESIDMLKQQSGRVFPMNGSTGGIFELIDNVVNSKADLSARMKYARTHLNFENVIDYLVIQCWSANRDWGNNNVKCWRSSELDARWHFLLNDLDVTLGRRGDNHVEYNMFDGLEQKIHTGAIDPPPAALLPTLLLDKDFRHRFLNRYADLLNSALLPAKTLPLLEAAITARAADIKRHRQRWPTSMKALDQHRELIEEFLTRRAEETRNNAVTTFDLPGLAELKLSVNVPGAGEIRLNSLQPADYPWQGIYFQGIPLAIEAIAAPGFRFAGWQDAALSQQPTLSLQLHGDKELTAIFASDEIGASSIVINEIMYKAADEADSDDWIELYNNGDEAVDLSSWVLMDEDNSHSFVIPQGSILEAGAFLLLCEDRAKFRALYPDDILLIGDFDFGLGSKPGDIVRLLNPDLELMDIVSYRSSEPWPPAANGKGPSLELIAPDLDNALPQSWRASGSTGPTPGRLNSTQRPSSVRPTNKTMAALLLCFPTPATEHLNVDFRLAQSGRIRLRLCTALGYTHELHVEQTQLRAGRHRRSFSLNGLPGGVYHCVLEVDSPAGWRNMAQSKVLIRR